MVSCLSQSPMRTCATCLAPASIVPTSTSITAWCWRRPCNWPARNMSASATWPAATPTARNSWRRPSATLYTQTRADLLAEFRTEERLGKRQGLNLSDLKEFTYWLHKRRVNYWDPARVAYDTRLAILRLEALRETAYTATLSQ